MSIQLPRVQTSVAQRSFAYNGPAAWNRLPSTLRDSSVSLTTHIQAATENVFYLHQEHHHPALLRHFCSLAPSCKTPDSLTYLLKGGRSGYDKLATDYRRQFITPSVHLS